MFIVSEYIIKQMHQVFKQPGKLGVVIHTSTYLLDDLTCVTTAVFQYWERSLSQLHQLYLLCHISISMEVKFRSGISDATCNLASPDIKVKH